MGADDGRRSGEAPPPLPDNVPALRVELQGRTITEASPAAGALLGLSPRALTGRRFADLLAPAERDAVNRRLDDVVLLGRDAFGALALSVDAVEPVWVEVQAHYVYRHGQRMEMALRRVDRPGGCANGLGGEAPRQEEEEAPRSSPLGAANARVAELGLEGATTALAVGALDSAGVAALAVAPDGTVAAATAATEGRLGRPIARVRGTHLADLFDLPPRGERALGNARRRGLRQSVLANLAGSEEQLILDWVPAPTEGSGVVLLNTGEAGAAQPVQSDAQRTQARLLSFVAHDVRECVVAVTMGIEIVRTELEPDSPLTESVDRALKESERAYRIIDDLLLVTRPGRRERVPLSLNAIIADTLDRFQPKAAEADVAIETDLGGDAVVQADLSNLERALGNLVENAVQATPAGGVVTIGTRVEERLREGVRITVADTGPGISPDILPNIFEPFVTNKSQGSGLGLAIVRRVVLDHGGQIDFDTHEEEGTSFHIWLPAPAADAPQDPAPV